MYILREIYAHTPLLKWFDVYNYLHNNVHLAFTPQVYYDHIDAKLKHLSVSIVDISLVTGDYGHISLPLGKLVLGIALDQFSFV